MSRHFTTNMFANRQHSLWILFLCCIVVAFGQFWKDLPRKYVVKRDFFKLIKAAQFSIMDEDEQRLFYRIESDFHVLQRIEVIRHPEKTRTANLSSEIKIGSYRANFSILDEKKNRWIDGEIEQYFLFLRYYFFIRWNGHQLNVTSGFAKRSYEFRNENNTLIADFSLRWFSGLWKKKYDLTVHTNRYPDELYFIGIAVADRRSSSKRKG